MSKYSHYEMCEKIFGERFKWDEKEKTYKVYSRTDMWNKLIEQQNKISELEEKLANMVRKYELASLPMGGLIDTARNLEQQLALSESEHERLIDTFEEETEKLRKQIKRESDARERFVKKVEELKQQLAEKEKELHYKTAECEKWKTDYENCSKLEKLMTKEHQYCLDNWRASEQDKIDFTIENLKQVKEKIANLDMPNNPKLYNDDMFQSGYDVHYVKVSKVIDNQIKQLKEGK